MKIAYRHGIRPDETVSSFVARVLRLSTSRSRAAALLEAIGAERARLHPYLTAHLSVIGQNLGVSEEDLLRRHTLYPIFNWFGFDRSSHLKETMLSNYGGRAIIAACLPHSKLQFYEGQKFCPACAEEDRARFGYAYCKVGHQIPGVEACYVHACQLVGIDSGDFGYDRFIPMVPTGVKPRLAPTSTTLLSSFSHDVLLLAQKSSSSLNYQDIYSEGLRLRGLLTEKKHVRIRSVNRQLMSSYQDYRFGSLLGMPEVLGTFKFVGSVLRHKTHYRCHPAKHLLFAFWLFRGQAKEYLAPRVEYKTSLTEKGQANQDLEQLVLDLLGGGISMNQIEKSLGKSRTFVRHVAEIHGIPHKSNSIAYAESIRREVVALAESGIHRRVIADHLGIGVGYVEQVIGNTQGLTDLRRDLRRQHKVDTAVAELKKVRSRYPGWLRKDIKTHCAPAFFTVYHYDKALLETLLPPKTRPMPPSKDWAKEDLRLSERIMSLKSASILSVSEIDHIVGARGLLRKHLAELPLTERLLREIGKTKY